MLRREEYIKNIEGNLTQIQLRVEHLNSLGLYDIDIIMEDFFCGLLNLIYGYELENVNKKKRNAKAIDLCDCKNKIAVQVTADIKPEKIQTTIDKFIESEMYQKFDRLVIVLLKSKPKYRKSFETKGVFQFDVEKDVLDNKEIMCAVNGLDTRVLEKVNSYTEYEKDRKFSKKSRRKIWCFLIAATFFVIFCIIVIRWNYEMEKNGKLYFSYISPYTFDSYESYDGILPVVQTELATKGAFSIINFIDSKGDDFFRVEYMGCEILNLEPVEEPIIQLDAAIVDNKLRLFAFNDGWGDSESLTVFDASFEWEENKQEFNDLCEEVHLEENAGISSAGAVLLAEYVLDISKYLEICEDPIDIEAYSKTCKKNVDIEPFPCTSNSIYIKFEVQGNSGTVCWGAYLKYEYGEFKLSDRLEYVDAMEIFLELDVDKRPSAITFKGPDGTPLAKDNLKIETVLVPTKSCIVDCRDVFYINGKKQQTDEYRVTVTVPVFQDNSIGHAGPLTKELAQLNRMEELQVKQIIDKYLYDPQNIREGE